MNSMSGCDIRLVFTLLKCLSLPYILGVDPPFKKFVRLGHTGTIKLVFRVTMWKIFLNNTDRTLDVAFSRLKGFSFTITLRQRPKGVTRILSVL